MELLLNAAIVPRVCGRDRILESVEAVGGRVTGGRIGGSGL